MHGSYTEVAPKKLREPGWLRVGWHVQAAYETLCPGRADRAAVNGPERRAVSAELEELRVQGTKRLSGLVVWLVLVGLVGTARADATVLVELKSAAGAAVDGKVELVKGETRHSCTTVKGRCELRSVAGGMYTVEVSVAGKAAPKPKQVMIPPTGEAKLVVNAD